MFTNPFPHAFGLDMSDLAIKLVLLEGVPHSRKQATFETTAARSIDLPPGLIVNGEIMEPEKVRKYVMHILGRDKEAAEGKKWKPIRSNWVVASIPDPQTFIKRISIPKSPVEIIEDDILEAAQKHIPFDPQSYYIDWQVIPRAEGDVGDTHVFIGAAPKQIANGYTYLLESIGLGVVALELESLAVARAMVTAAKEYEHEARAILDLGGNRSMLIIYDGECVQFSISLSFSGNLLTQKLAEALGISPEEAEKKKRERGLDYAETSSTEFMTSTALVSELVVEIQKGIQFYASHFEGANMITHITMCGGSSNLKKLDSFLTEKLGITAQIGHPWKNLSSRHEPLLGAEASLGFATAIGLALRAADNPFFERTII